MNQLEEAPRPANGGKLVYTAKTHTTGGRENEAQVIWSAEHTARLRTAGQRPLEREVVPVNDLYCAVGRVRDEYAPGREVHVAMIEPA